MVTKLPHATMYVLDQDEALKFYTGKLGFEAVFKDNSGNWFSLTQQKMP